jgi:hypothetical protein
MRLVERQGVQATRRTTDSLDGQSFLEASLEDCKPVRPHAQEYPARHRLLLTHFRYSKPHGLGFPRSLAMRGAGVEAIEDHCRRRVASAADLAEQILFGH